MHKQIYRPGVFGGTMNTTLCGRMQTTRDGANVSDEVTCKLCLKKLASTVNSGTPEDTAGLKEKE